MDSKGAGLISGLIIGICGLVVGVIFAFLIIQEVATVHEEIETADWNRTVTNESGRVNWSGYTLAGASVTGFKSAYITSIWNVTTNGLGTYNYSVGIANATISSAGNVTNTSALNWHDTYISYNYLYKGQSTAVERMQANFTEGIDNVADKIPTVLLIAAVVLILGVLVLLWTQYKRMNIGGGGGGSEL